MPRELKISVGQHSDKGRKETNQDFHGVLIPNEPLLSLEGHCDRAGRRHQLQQRQPRRQRSPTVKGFLTDYYCTSEAWSVKTSAQRVIAATNSWLHSQTRRSQYSYDKDKGYVCTLSAMVIKSATAHLFHVGDSRIYRVSGNVARATDQRSSRRSSRRSRAISAARSASIRRSRSTTRRCRSSKGDVFLLATDGVHEYVGARFIAKAISDGTRTISTQRRAAIVEEAYDAGQRGQPDRPDRPDR